MALVQCTFFYLIRVVFHANHPHLNLHFAAVAATQIVMKKMMSGNHHLVIIKLRRRYTTKHGEVSRRLLFSA